MKNNKTITRVICIVASFIISIVLTALSMEAIKKVPGNSFATEADYVATTLLVFGLWLFVILAGIWLIEYYINLQRSKKHPPDKIAQTVVQKKAKHLKIFAKIIIGILNIAVIWWLIVFSITAVGFSGLGLPFGIWIAFVLANAIILLSIIACGISKLIVTIKLKHNPYDKKMLKTREKIERVLWILIISYICLYVFLFLIIRLI